MKNCDECRKQGFRGHDPLMEAVRRDIRERIDKIIEEERDAYLGAGDYERTEERRGYRRGFQKTPVTLAVGKIFQGCDKKGSLICVFPWPFRRTKESKLRI